MLDRPECKNYWVLDEETRSSNYNEEYYNGFIVYNSAGICDQKTPVTYGSRSQGKSPNWRGEGWYRFQRPAGTKLAQSPPGYYFCGTDWTGWSNSTLPNLTYESFDITVCFGGSVDNGNAKDCDETIKGKVTNCGSFLVYYLSDTPACPYRYCANIW